MKLTLDASPQASILQAYFATGTLNLSAYQKISFWIKNSAAIVANNWKVCLCSDNAGATPVDTFYITAIPSTARWLPLTLTKDGGGNLSSSIQSIAIYTDSSAPTASSNILVDDFIACTTNGLNLQSLISKNSAEQGGTEPWHGIKSIDGTTIILDNDTNSFASAGRGYYGTTETVTTYKRETIKTAMSSGPSNYVQQIMEGGDDGNNIQFQGGYDTGTSNQTGETFFDGLNGFGYGITGSVNYVTLNRLNFVRYSYGCYKEDAGIGWIISSMLVCASTYAGCYLAGSLHTITYLLGYNNTTQGLVIVGGYQYCNTVVLLNNASHGFQFSGNCSGNIIASYKSCNNGNAGVDIYSGNGNTILSGELRYNASYGITIEGGTKNIFKSITTSNNTTAAIYNLGEGNILINCTIGESAEVYSLSGANAKLYSHNHDNTAGNHWIFVNGATINAQTTTRHTASGIAWTLTPAAARISTYPLDFKVAKIACAANALVTVKIWMIKGHATNVAGKLVCRGGQLAGVPSDVTATKADDTSWEELTITFTPTEAGVIEIEAWAYYVAGVSTVTVDDMTISQA
jgi:hypothetical protein